MATYSDIMKRKAAVLAQRQAVQAQRDAPMEPGNIDLSRRPIYKHPNGEYSTVYTATFKDPKGNGYVNVPMVAPDGSKMWSEREALDAYGKTGQHLGKFRHENAAVKAAGSLHEEQAGDYDRLSQMPKAYIDDWNRQLTQVGPTYSGPTNFRGDPVSSGQAKPEAGVESTTPPWEYLAAAGGLAGAAGDVLASKAVRNAPAAWEAAAAAFSNPQKLAQGYRLWGQEVGNRAAAESLAKAAESVPLWQRATEAVKTFKNYTPRPSEEVDLIKDMASRARVAASEEANKVLPSMAEDYTPSAPDAATAVVGGKR